MVFKPPCSIAFVINMPEERLNRKIFIWSVKYAKVKFKNWVFKTMDYFRSHGSTDLLNVNDGVNKRYAINVVRKVSFNQYIQEWEKELSREKGKRTGNNKLRTYRFLKNTLDTENYVKYIFNKKYRSSLAKFRCGTAPIRLELGRYEGLPVEDRKCPA